MIGLIGKKLGMSQVFLPDGTLVPVSVIQAGPCPIIQIKSEKSDGYNAIQLGFSGKKRLGKPIKGHIKRAGVKSVVQLREIRVKNPENYKVGANLDVSIFSDGDKLKVTGWTKGRGFTGGMKRWGWSGGPATHGGMSHRRVGSSGAGTSPGRIWKGKTMPGRYGNEQVTTKNLKVIKIEKEKNLIYLKGAVPGARNNYLLLIKEE